MRCVCAMLLVVAARAADYAGPAACRPCHAKQHATQSRSHHARALRPAAETPLLSLLTSHPVAERSGIAFDYSTSPGGIRVTTTQGSRADSAWLEWAFGSGAQAITPVGRRDGVWIEHRISYYTAAQGPRRTLGHPGAPSTDPRSALGIPQDSQTISRCFGCHATNVQPGPKLDAMLPGVTCERCHGPAGAHAGGQKPMTSLKRLDRERITSLCGECHRVPDAHAPGMPEANDALSIRFSPVGLTASACYRKSKLSCLTCHDPHSDASRNTAFYAARCTGCHATQPAACKTSDCLSCHMQRRSPAPYLTFTDHRVRVYR